MLASQGGAPDFMLTLWDWRQETVVLRTKAFSQDVYKVTFSKYLKGILTTSGTGHIKYVIETKKKLSKIIVNLFVAKILENGKHVYWL